MDINKRNKDLIKQYESGKTLQEISDECGLSKTQLSRIFRSAGTKRKKFELDKKYFDNNKNKTDRQISEETGITIKRVRHLKRIASGAKLSRGKTDFTDCSPVVDPGFINDREWLYDEYVTKHNGAPTIAKKLGSKCSSVYKALRDFKIKRRTTKEAMDIIKKWPSKEWLYEHYEVKKLSIDRCAMEFGSGWDSIYESLKHYGFELRNASEQHLGELNHFYGKSHTDNTRNKCATIGSKYGKMYWSTGDIEAKKALASSINKDIWSDPDKRSAASKMISELCRQGKCNSKNIQYMCKNGESIKLKSTWEFSVAKELDNSDLVCDWKYEDVSIEYCDGDVIRNFVVDFWVKWVDGFESLIECKNQKLLTEEKEQLKIKTLKEYCDRHNYGFILIDSKEEAKKMSFGFKSFVNWINGNRYKVKREYLNEPKLFVDMMLHEITNKVCPWKPLKYNNSELYKDIDRLKRENLKSYFSGDDIKSTAPNSGGMPGRLIMTHFNPHFWDVANRYSEPLPKAFENKDIIYKCLNISYKENESLSIERLLREINFHYTTYGRTSHFAPGFTRTVIRMMDMSGKRIFDPCCGWGGRMIGSWLEECKYSGCDISPLTFDGLINISKFIGYDCDIYNRSCVEMDWPESDLIFTSPPFYDVEHYVGGDQPWDVYKSREDWIDGFVGKFIDRIKTKCVLYLDEKTKDDFEQIKKFDEIIKIKNRRHARHKTGFELLCVYE